MPDETRLTEKEALDQIAAVMDGHEWDGGTLCDVAEILARTGREVNEPDTEDGHGLACEVCPPLPSGLPSCPPRDEEGE